MHQDTEKHSTPMATGLTEGRLTNT